MIPISYVLPTRNRPDDLARTLGALGALPVHDAEVIVVDNASTPPAHAPAVLGNGIGVRVLRRETNEGAAARNAGAAATDRRSAWVVMLDDDSHPLDIAFAQALHEAPGDVLALSADIVLPAQARRESGGLPEVFIGCGVAIRRDAFACSGGYDPAFGYYAEEYDLAARLLMSGGRVQFEPRFRVAHHKVPGGRDVDLILSRLVRNNGWVIQRYAPERERRAELGRMIGRYRRIAEKEGACAGFGAGLAELRRTIRGQRRSPMTDDVFARFTGLAYARDALAQAMREAYFETARIVEDGKNAHVVRRALRELGVREVGAPDDAREAEALVIGTLSPGPMLDAAERLAGASAPSGGLRVIAPWLAGGPGPALVGAGSARCAAHGESTTG
ncbi:MAG: glycosyltransferase [Phycisphaerales bacterium]|nr:glycosyltransferase [Phycisphaerales bacterium]